MRAQSSHRQLLCYNSCSVHLDQFPTHVIHAKSVRLESHRWPWVCVFISSNTRPHIIIYTVLGICYIYIYYYLHDVTNEKKYQRWLGVLYIGISCLRAKRVLKQHYNINMLKTGGVHLFFSLYFLVTRIIVVLTHIRSRIRHIGYL